MNDTWRDRCLFQRLWMSCRSTAAATSGRWGQDPETDLPVIATFSDFPSLPTAVISQDSHRVQLLLLLMVRNWGRSSFQKLRVARKNTDAKKKTPRLFQNTWVFSYPCSETRARARCEMCFLRRIYPWHSDVSKVPSQSWNPSFGPRTYSFLCLDSAAHRPCWLWSQHISARHCLEKWRPETGIALPQSCEGR